MVSSEILKSLKEKDLSDIEEIKYKKGFVLVRFFYDFDKDELSAAKAYADEENTYESESEEWYKELYLPYLYDIALDNVEEVIDEVMEESEVEGQFLAYDVDINNPTYGEFVALFNDINEEKDIEEVMDELGL